VLYPTAFPNLKAYTKNRSDIQAIFLTGLPAGVVSGFQNNLGAGTVNAELQRLNVAVPPPSNPNRLGLIAGDAAGFPNGRRVIDDVTTIELRALAGVTIPLVDPSFTPDGAAGAIKDGSDTAGAGTPNTAYLANFPYLGIPISGTQYRPGAVVGA